MEFAARALPPSRPTGCVVGGCEKDAVGILKVLFTGENIEAEVDITRDPYIVDVKSFKPLPPGESARKWRMNIRGPAAPAVSKDPEHENIFKTHNLFWHLEPHPLCLEHVFTWKKSIVKEFTTAEILVDFFEKTPLSRSDPYDVICSQAVVATIGTRILGPDEVPTPVKAPALPPEELDDDFDDLADVNPDIYSDEFKDEASQTLYTWRELYEMTRKNEELSRTNKQILEDDNRRLRGVIRFQGELKDVEEQLGVHKSPEK